MGALLLVFISFVICLTQGEVVEVCPTRTINFTSGLVVTSPNHPGNYDSDTDCLLTIVLPRVSNVTLAFTADHHVEGSGAEVHCFDKLVINGLGTSETKTFCGATLPEAYTIDLVTTVGMQFTTDDIGQYSGFRVVLNAAEAVEVCTARTIDFTSGLVVTSPNYPGNYDPFTDCFLTIVLPRVSNVTLTFTHMDMQAGAGSNCLDQLLISGRSEIRKFCGSTLPEVYTIGLITTVGMLFTADGSNQLSGFRLVLSAVEADVDIPEVPKPMVYESCQEAADFACTPRNGFYDIKAFGVQEGYVPVICSRNVDDQISNRCPGVGWTTVMMTSANNAMLYYDDGNWQDASALAMRSIGHDYISYGVSTILPTLWSTEFNELCIERPFGTSNRSLVVAIEATSFQKLFADNQEREINVSISDWNSFVGYTLIDDVSGMLVKQGFNIKTANSSARFGIIIEDPNNPGFTNLRGAGSGIKLTRDDGSVQNYESIYKLQGSDELRYTSYIYYVRYSRQTGIP